jgi:hypothetical protein
MPVPYEPKRKNRWLLRFEEGLKIQEWVMLKASRPKLTKTKWWNFWSKINVEPITIIMTDPIGLMSTSGNLHKMFVNDKVVNFDLEMLDPLGVSIEKWECKDCKIISVDFGNLDYSEGGLVTCEVKLKPKTVDFIY